MQNIQNVANFSLVVIIIQIVIISLGICRWKKNVQFAVRIYLKNTDLEDIEESLKQKLGLRIKISPSKQGGGKVVLQYASAAELDMIVEILNQRKQLEKISQNTVFKSCGDEKEKFSIKFIE